jgi:DNA-binding beta-propeller fold protein YncE
VKKSIAFLTVAALAGVALAADVTLRKEKEIPLPGKGGFDYVNADAAARRAFVAHGTKIDVVDLDSGAVVGSVEGVEGAHGALLAPGTKLGFATAGRKKRLIAFDAATLKATKEIETGEGPDALLYVSTTKEVWTMNHRAGTVTCVDAASLEVKATIEVGGALESAVEYVAKGMVFVNVENKSQIAAIDAKKHEVLARWALDPAKEPTGLAIDEKKGVLFAGCGSGHMAVVDAATGKVLATPAIGDHCDACAFDPETGLAFASCGDGTTTVVRAGEDGTFTAAAKIDTAPGARTCAVDRKTHKLWVCAGTRGKDDVRLLVFGQGEAALR